MKHLKHPATIIAAVALFVALGGGAVAYAAGVINGSQIKNHSIATKKLTKKAIKQLHGAKGATGPAGAPGAPGAPGATGPQGPGGHVIDYNATAVVGTPTPTALGTALGVTLGATCVSSSGDAELTIYLKTSDGSWTIDYLAADSLGNAIAVGGTIPAGTLSNLTPVLSASAASGGASEDIQYQFLQLGPAQAGRLLMHMRATTTSAPSATCHAAIEAIPETLTAVAGAPRAGTSGSGKALLHSLRQFGRH